MPNWTREAIAAALKENGISFEIRDIENGVQFRLPQGTPVDLYERTGKVVVRGKQSDERTKAERLFGASSAGASANFNPVVVPVVTTSIVGAGPTRLLSPVRADDSVFVVYGHDTQARDALELMLLRMNLKPVILGNMAPEGKTIIEALISNTNVKYAVILLTPDDEGFRAGHPEEKKFRARQNVVLELGMFLTSLGRERVAILHKGSLELPSDISGLVYIPFQNSVQEAKNKLAASLQRAGFYIDINALSAE
jgi:Predicted nucleotide-binding protein containing TIR-like domain